MQVLENAKLRRNSGLRAVLELHYCLFCYRCLEGEKC